MATSHFLDLDRTPLEKHPTAQATQQETQVPELISRVMSQNLHPIQKASTRAYQQARQAQRQGK